MINFKRVTVEDKKLYEKYMFSEVDRGCEFAFANLVLWGNQNIAELDGHCLLFSHFGGTTVYPFPLGAGDVKPLIDAIIKDAGERGIPCVISGIRPDKKELLERLYPDKFRFHGNRGSFDYVYDINALADLKGRKYQSKRNHCHRFEDAYPDYHTEIISDSNIEKVKAMAEEWYASRLRENPDRDYDMERKALERAFKYYRELCLEGMALINGGEVLAFTMANRMNEITFDVNFEKAVNVQGAYAVINREFANYIRDKYPEVLYLDREEDMGLEGLRKAKESYYPHHLVEKYRGILLDE